MVPRPRDHSLVTYFFEYAPRSLRAIHANLALRGPRAFLNGLRVRPFYRKRQFLHQRLKTQFNERLSCFAIEGPDVQLDRSDAACIGFPLERSNQGAGDSLMTRAGRNHYCSEVADSTGYQIPALTLLAKFRAQKPDWLPLLRHEPVRWRSLDHRGKGIRYDLLRSIPPVPLGKSIRMHILHYAI
jgi:hypothetical protein